MNKKVYFDLRTLILLSLFVGMSIVLKLYFSLTLVDIRISLFDIPLMVAGMLSGPIGGALAGFAVDWLYIIQTGFGFNLMTIESIVWGLIPGLFFLYVKRYSLKKVSVMVAITALLAYVINSIQLYYVWKFSIFPFAFYRFFVTLIKIPIDVYILHTVYTRVIVVFKKENS